MMTLSLEDLQMMLAALAEMIGELPPEVAMTPCDASEAKLWSAISVDGPQPVKLYLGADEETLKRFVKGFAGEEALESFDLGSDLVISVLKEMVNVVGGNLRGAFNIEGQLSLPSIIAQPALPCESFESWDAQARLWVAIEGMTLHG